MKGENYRPQSLIKGIYTFVFAVSQKQNLNIKQTIWFNWWITIFIHASAFHALNMFPNSFLSKSRVL